MEEKNFVGFIGETEIYLTRNESFPIEQLRDELSCDMSDEEREKNYSTLSRGKFYKSYSRALITSIVDLGVPEKLVHITLNSDSEMTCAMEQEFLNEFGTFTKASNLKKGTKIAAWIEDKKFYKVKKVEVIDNTEGLHVYGFSAKSEDENAATYIGISVKTYSYDFLCSLANVTTEEESK